MDDEMRFILYILENDLPGLEEMWSKLENKMVKASEFFEKSLFDKLVEHFEEERND